MAAARMAERTVSSLLSLAEGNRRVQWSRLAEALAGPEERLDEPVRHRMEGILGHELGEVRVHSSPQVEPMATYLGAEAFTVGPRVFAPPDRLNPQTERGAGLLAHELAHVVQQTRPLPLAGRAVGRMDAPTPSGLQLARSGGQETADAGESQAREAERAGESTARPHGAPRAQVDVEALAERVYTLMKRDLQLERERQGQPW